MNTKNVRISINPETFENMSPEGVKASVARRAARAVEKKNTTARGLSIFLCTILLLSVAAFAATAVPNRADEVVEPEPVVAGTMGSWELSSDDLATVTAVVGSVARGEGPLAQQAVAQALRNSAEDFNMTISEVVTEYRWPCDYTGATTSSIQHAINSVFTDGVPAVNARIHTCYNPDLQDGTWFESGMFITEIGSLRFFK